jgi:secreted trypsin-like serine protease
MEVQGSPGRWSGRVAAVVAAVFAFVAVPPAHAGGVSEPMIIGGSPTGAHEFPWQVALIAKSERDALKGLECGGILIAPRWVLTAAHCMTYDSGKPIDAKIAQVLAGTADLRKGGERVDIARFVLHPKFNTKTYENDIALVQLKADVREDTLGLLGAKDEARYASPGSEATASGWGLTRYDPPKETSALQKVKLPIVSNAACRKHKFYASRVKPGMLCAGLERGGKDTCSGDSGGPLMVKTERGKWLLAGITSWGLKCASPGKYGVYTRVAAHAEWIARVTGGN